MYRSLPKSSDAEILGQQALRAGTSVGAHYREAAHGRSSAEFISKIELACQEMDETNYWLQLLIGGGMVPQEKMHALLQESTELLAILITCAKNAKRKARENSKKSEANR